MRSVMQSVEWSALVAKIHLPPAIRYVLPELTGVITEETTNAFRTSVPVSNQITTVAACFYSEKSFHDRVKSIESANILIVGGNDKSASTLTTKRAIEIAREVRDGQIWAVSDPNSRHCLRDMETKQSADGIICQPCFTTQSWSNIDEVASSTDARFLVGGLAYIRSISGLNFWISLLDDFQDTDDPLFVQTVQSFTEKKDNQEWTKEQYERLLANVHLDGVHHMPLREIDVLKEIIRA